MPINMSQKIAKIKNFKHFTKKKKKAPKFKIEFLRDLCNESLENKSKKSALLKTVDF